MSLALKSPPLIDPHTLVGGGRKNPPAQAIGEVHCSSWSQFLPRLLPQGISVEGSKP